MHLHIGFNMPGCLPESEVSCTDNVALAIDVLESDMNSAAYAGTDLDSTSRLMDAHIRELRALALQDPNRFIRFSSTYADGYCYWIEAYEGDYLHCEAGDDPITAPYPSVAPMFRD